MNLQTEQAIAMWLSDSGHFIGTAILCGQSDSEIPNDQSVIFVACESTESPASALYRANVRLILSSPSVMENSLDAHRILFTSLRAELRNASSMVPYFSAHSIACSGAVLDRFSESQDNQRWLSQADLILGLVDQSA